MTVWRKGFAWKALLSLVVVWCLAVVLTARHGEHSLYPASGDTVTIYVLDNGFHTDIVLPTAEVVARGGILARAAAATGGGDWLAYGWGDAGFFTGKGASFGRALDGLRALFHPGNPSVVRVFAFYRQPDAKGLVLSRAGFEAMAAHMEASFVTADGAPVLDPVATPGSPFFTSREHFSIVRLCNNWTADQLSAGGLPTAPMVDGLAPLLALDLKLRGGV